MWIFACREGGGHGLSQSALGKLTMELVAKLPESLEVGQEEGIAHARRLVTALQVCLQGGSVNGAQIEKYGNYDRWGANVDLLFIASGFFWQDVEFVMNICSHCRIYESCKENSWSLRTSHCNGPSANNLIPQTSKKITTLFKIISHIISPCPGVWWRCCEEDAAGSWQAVPALFCTAACFCVRVLWSQLAAVRHLPRRDLHCAAST